MDKKPNNIDEYIFLFPKQVQERLELVRKTVHDTEPDATEAISYQMPTFKLNGKNMIHFAGFKSHIGLYPLPTVIDKFQKELSEYPQGKGSVQFPLDRPIPYEVIREIVKFRADEIRNS